MRFWLQSERGLDEDDNGETGPGTNHHHPDDDDDDPRAPRFHTGSSISNNNNNRSHHHHPQQQQPSDPHHGDDDDTEYFDPEYELFCDASTFPDILNDQQYNALRFQNNNNNNNNNTDPTIAAAAASALSSSSSSSSSIAGAIFNFTNCIVGAGAIGLGGAMAASGGLLSIATIVSVAILVQTSLHLVMTLSTTRVPTPSATEAGVVVGGVVVSYEALGAAAYGTAGRRLVMSSKFAYAFGCLVAYTVVLHDNFGPAMRHLLHYYSFFGSNDDDDESSDHPHHFRWWWKVMVTVPDWLLCHDVWCTWTISSLTILPLCLLRDMTPLAGLSALSIGAMVAIVTIIIYLWYIDIDNEIIHPTNANNDDDNYNNPNNTLAETYYYNSAIESRTRGLMRDYVDDIISRHNRTNNTDDDRRNDFYKHWLEIRWLGFLNNMGTFVFTFVCHHTVHLAYGSLKPELRRNNSLRAWNWVSASSVAIACAISLTVGIFCYMTFWERTESDIFKIYPESIVIDLAKILLCMTMVLTFPLPFFSCRELLVEFFFAAASPERLTTSATRGVHEISELDGTAPLMEASQNVSEPANVDIAESAIQHNPERNSGESLQEASSNRDSIPESSTGFCRSDSNDSTSISLDLSTLSTQAIQMMSTLMVHPNRRGQLKLPYHIGLTLKLWFVVTVLAIAAPNLGDVLALVGCASGTLIAFVLPGLFSMKLQGYTHVAAVILVVGVVVGSVGSICSIKQITKDYMAKI